ncbi:hypothetical protein [Roseivivax lentus]|uniref:hypothetical protein n=1 Tax=Roseivivax lentus TaxID=633194 RepID=UPI00117B9574|nr:hypothetical protein [Roseivivax lentus]
MRDGSHCGSNMLRTHTFHPLEGRWSATFQNTARRTLLRAALKQPPARSMAEAKIDTLVTSRAQVLFNEWSSIAGAAL